MMPHLGIVAADHDDLEQWLRRHISEAMRLEHPDAAVLSIEMDCGEVEFKDWDDLPWFSVPCECGEGHYVLYTRDDEGFADWPSPSKPVTMPV